MSVARAAAQGVAWNMIFGVSSRLASLIGTLILTHFIAPEAYGAVLAAAFCVQTAGLVTSFAFGQYLIAHQSSPRVAFQAAQAHFFLGLISMTVMVAFRGQIAALFDIPQAAPYVAWYALAQMIDRARYVPERLLIRDLRFRRMAMMGGAGEIACTAVALLLAPHLGALAIPIGVVARSVTIATLVFATTNRKQWLVYAPLEREVVRGLFGYGLPIMIAAVADYAASRWDNLVVSKLFGPAVMARYNLAYSLAETPIDYVAEHIGEVLMPSFVRMEDDQRRTAVVRAAALMALVVSPLGVGLGAIAHTLVKVFFDPRWSEMAPMLVILSVMTLFRPMSWSAMAYLQAVKQTRLIMISSVSRAFVVLPLVGLLGFLGGPLWACAGGCIGYAVHTVGTIVAAGYVTNLSTSQYLVGVFRPLLACVPMWLGVWGIEVMLRSLGVPSVVSLIAQIVVGAVLYVGASFVLVRPTAREMVRLGREVIQRRSKAEIANKPGPKSSSAGGL